MKNIFISISIVSLLFATSCKDEKQQEVEDRDLIENSIESEEMHDETHIHEDQAPSTLDNSWTSEISLDNGSKWKANKETTQGVKNMLAILESTETETVEAFHDLADKLNDEKNIVIKECTMEGPSHDNLHIFLHPLIDKIAALHKVETLDDGFALKESIWDNLQKYHNYFQ